MNGYELLALSGSTNTAEGIACTTDNRVTVKNGTIRGFQDGVVLGAGYANVNGLLITNSLRTGISVNGNHSQISHNRVADTGGSPTAAYAIGISLTGTYGVIIDNDVQNTCHLG